MIKPILKLLPPSWRKAVPVVNVVRLEGAIVAGRGGFQQKLNGRELEPVLRKAFRKGVSGVALQINCPGGSPVQSALIATRIRTLATKHKIPVYAFCEDVAASGGYWLACAADEIYADENSIVGSIGVISMGFDFPKALGKLGVERRVYTSGESESSNDLFKPEKPEAAKRLKILLIEIHGSFKAMVRNRRAGKLRRPEKDLVSRAFWTGAKAAEMGLVDGIGQMHHVLSHKFGDRLELRSVESGGGWGLKRIGFGQITDLPDATIDALEVRALGRVLVYNKVEENAMRLFKSLALGLVGLVATYAMKKAVKKIESQMAEAKVRAQTAQNPRELKEVKRLRQDPATGVYFARD